LGDRPDEKPSAAWDVEHSREATCDEKAVESPQNTFRGTKRAFALSIVTTKPSPSLPPDCEMFWLTTPMTSPAMLNNGPPELPVLIVAVVWKNSARGMSRKMVLAAQRALIQPTLSEYESP
jgi:hypothetical protein